MNVGMRPMVSEASEALSLDRLFWTEQNYIREATLTPANADLVDYHSRLDIVAVWGGGEPASADGLRFVVPVKTSELFRYLAGGGTPTPIGRALMELGRLDRSIYLASYFDDELL